VPTIALEFRGDLVELVRGSPPAWTGTRLVREVPEIPSLKDAIEAAGVPHVEVGGVSTPDGAALALDAPVPVTQPAVVHPIAPYRLEPPRFICDQHLGKLARLLRILGFDTVWNRTMLEPELARRALNEDRAVLSRGRAVLVRKSIARGLFIRSADADEQAVEALRRFQLADRVELFGRCSLCNGELVEVEKASVAARIPPRTSRWLDTYYLCSGCDQLYWEGTHVAALNRRLEAIVHRAGTG
jgi:hypothetical protein